MIGTWNCCDAARKRSLIPGSSSCTLLSVTPQALEHCHYQRTRIHIVVDSVYLFHPLLWNNRESLEYCLKHVAKLRGAVEFGQRGSRIGIRKSLPEADLEEAHHKALLR